MNNTWLLAYVALQQGQDLERARRKRDVPEIERVRRRRSSTR
jgi:hypothetical protein